MSSSRSPDRKLKPVTIDAASAVAYLAHALSDAVFALPNTPESILNLLLTWSDQKEKNRDGSAVQFLHVKNPTATLPTDIAAVKGTNLSVFLDADLLIKVVPSLYQLASSAITPSPRPLAVFYANASSISSAHASLPVLAHITPFAVLFSAESSAQEARDVASIAHFIVRDTTVPAVVLRSLGGPNLFQPVEERAFPQVHGSSRKFAGSSDVVLESFAHASSSLGVEQKFFEYVGSASPSHVIVFAGVLPHEVEEAVHHLVQSAPRKSPLHLIGVIRSRVFRPWSGKDLIQALPKSTKHVAVLEVSRVGHPTSHFGPLFLDVAATLHSEENAPAAVVEARLKVDGNSILYAKTIEKLFHDFIVESRGPRSASFFETFADAVDVPHGATVGIPIPLTANESDVDGPYISVLSQFFKERLHLTNVVDEETVTKPGSDGLSAEFGLGRHLAEIQGRERFIMALHQFVSSNAYLPAGLADAIREYVKTPESNVEHAVASGKQALQAIEAAVKQSSSLPEPVVHGLKNLLPDAKSFLGSTPAARWLLGGDRLAYDIGSSGVHHVIASKSNVKILVLDTQPYAEKKRGDNRKKDIGLYAMTYGGVYVASVALHASYAGVVRALQEADEFDGPAVVLAYSPRQAIGSSGLVKGGGGVAATASLAALKETKLAIDEGLWPLYRWKPGKATSDGEDLEEPIFTLDSEKLRGELNEFLERNQYLSMVANAEPEFSTAVGSSIEKELKDEAEAKIRSAYDQLVAGLNVTPVLILYGSDGGNAASVAKKVAAEARQRGLKPKVSVMDDFSVEDLARHKDVLFVVSTAGQGEFPGNSRELWKGLQQATPASAEHLSQLRYSVFAMGDSHYWPLPEDAHYFCKSGKDLDARLAALGARRLYACGIGDDRAADGYMTGYREWIPEVWTVLGVGGVEVSDAAAAAAAPSDDAIKTASNFLRGTIAPGLEDTSTGALSELDTKITKFHGIYQQDDRDLRDARARAGLEKAFSFMVRVRVPGGVATPQQWIAVDDISNSRANGTIKLTTRQAFQFHGIVKRNLKRAIQEINQALMDTIAACGDVNRNVMCNPNPHSTAVHAQVLEFTRKFSDHLTPRTSAYHEIWLDKKVVATSEDVEPIYGKTYLPRKFKVAVAVPPNNDVDVFAHDLGYIAIAEGDRLIGFNVTVGGGMGMTHGMKTTYPRLGDILGFCTVEQAVAVGEQVVTVQRDFGDRTNRKHARLKYTIDDRGVEWFKGEVEKRLGYKLLPAKQYKLTSNADRYGWIEGPKVGGQPTWSYGLFVQNGRVKDTHERSLKTGLRELAVLLEKTKAEFRLSPNQNLVIANIPGSLRASVDALLARYQLENGRLSGLRLNSMACVALPTCALAMAESERYLPDLVGKIETLLEEQGLRDDAITIRMTGCPNGCARPQIAEIAFVGKAPGTYNMYLGGGHNGERLNKIYKESVTEEEIIRALQPIIKDYAGSKVDGEHFGDFVIRKGYVKATIRGKDFHDV
ncbi:hypothetical protein DFJ73DRAFT_327075 [Zopfochytrium polystomum]|nr:hypothetical protein DFJ73DRAFT_327075 [Zopfochytrium polystomum]